MKKNKLNITDQYFKNSLDDLQATPSFSVWDGLEKQLLGKNALQKKTRKGVRKEMLFVALLIIAFVFGFYAINENTQPTLGADISQNANTPQISNTDDNLPNSYNEQSPATAIFMEKTKDNPISEREPTANKIKTKYSLNKITPEVKTENESSVTVKGQNPGWGENNVVPKIKIKRGVDNLNKIKIASTDRHQINNALQKIKPSTLNCLTFKNTNQLTLHETFLDKKSFWDKWAYSPWYSIERNFRSLKSNPEFDNPNPTPEYFNEFETPKLSWSLGIDLSYALSKKWNIKTGLALVNHQIGTASPFQAIYSSQNPMQLFVFTSYNTNRIQFDANSITAEENELVDFDGNFKQQIQFLNIPLMASYSISKNRYKVNLSAGANINLPINSKIIDQSTSPDLSQYEQIYSEKSDKIFYGYQGAAHFHYYFKKGISIYLGPYFNYAFTSANKNKSVQYFPRRCGLQIGIEKQFKQ